MPGETGEWDVVDGPLGGPFFAEGDAFLWDGSSQSELAEPLAHNGGARLVVEKPFQAGDIGDFAGGPKGELDGLALEFLVLVGDCGRVRVIGIAGAIGRRRLICDADASRTGRGGRAGSFEDFQAQDHVDGLAGLCGAFGIDNGAGGMRSAVDVHLHAIVKNLSGGEMRRETNVSVRCGTARRRCCGDSCERKHAEQAANSREADGAGHHVATLTQRVQRCKPAAIFSFRAGIDGATLSLEDSKSRKRQSPESRRTTCRKKHRGTKSRKKN